VKELQKENAALRADLAPFNDAFFSELRRLQEEHAELQRRCVRFLEGGHP
jgi:hypothetical protein